MYSHIINALTGKYLQSAQTDQESLTDEVKLYINKGEVLLDVVKETVLREIFDTALQNWDSKTLDTI